MAQGASLVSPARLEIGPFTVGPRGLLPVPWPVWLGEALRPTAEPLSPPPTVDDETILPALSFHGVARLLYLRLRAAAVWQHLSPALQQGLAASYQRNTVRSFLLQDELAHITAALRRAPHPGDAAKGTGGCRDGVWQPGRASRSCREAPLAGGLGEGFATAGACSTNGNRVSVRQEPTRPAEGRVMSCAARSSPRLPCRNGGTAA